MFDVFNPRDGRPVVHTRFRWIARLICAIYPALDYARQGEGWL